MSRFSSRLLDWFAHSGRHDLPWQIDPTPYRVWVSEIMLQQTQVQTVIPYYHRFMTRFPTLNSLAASSEEEVLTLWTGLGYYARARNLHAAARKVMQEHDGVFPDQFEQVVALPGIGRSTAGAILALAFQQRHPILDGNVKRVLTRYHLVEGWPGRREVERRLWEYAEQHTPEKEVAQYTQAMMDLGATVCRRHQPQCARCPQKEACLAHLHQRVGDFPTPKPTPTPRPERRELFLLIQEANAPSPTYLLIRRPSRGIWGGLWTLPDVSLQAFSEREALLLPTGGVVEQREFELFREFEHHFTHYILKGEVYFAKLTTEQILGREKIAQPAWLWYDFSSPKAIPPPLAKILKEASDHDKNGFL